MADTIFTDGFFEVLGAWQRGWREDPAQRRALAAELARETHHLPDWVRRTSGLCFRKRFLYTHDLGAIVLASDGLDEGPASWTKLPRFARDFHGLYRNDAVAAALFMHETRPEEVILDITALWQDPGFVSAIKDYQDRDGANSDALTHFRADQGEVILHAPLQWKDIVGLAGIGSSFDELADQIGLVESARDTTMRALIDANVYPSEPTWVWGQRAQGILLRARNATIDKINALLSRDNS